jgi:hypothetical protein
MHRNRAALRDQQSHCGGEPLSLCIHDG